MATAIYARFSTDKQRETSIDDQVALCRKHETATGPQPPSVFSDAGISGSIPVRDRPGAAAMMKAALADEFDTLLLEGLDRLSRDLVEQETIVRRLEHRGVRIVGVSDGYDSLGGDVRVLARGVRGLINEAYLRDLRHKVHRGLVGQVDRGMHAGGISFGYRSVAVEGGKRLEIDKAQAAIVRRIFASFAAGDSCQRIAATLNAEGVRGPRGTWSVSALFGSPLKGAGVLNNELYVGRYIWNRSKWLKNPDTGKRERIVRPREEWKVVARPDLRILDDATWAAVRARMDRRRANWAERPTNTPSKTLFGGLMRCARCGGPMIAINTSQYGCAHHKDRGPAVCTGTYAPRKDLERRLLGYVRDELLSVGAVDDIVAQALEIDRQARDAARDDSKGIQQRQRALRGEIDRLVTAIAEIGISPALAAKLRSAEAELAALKVREVAPAKAIDHAAIRAHVRAMLVDLGARLDGDRERAREALRQALGPIVIERDDEGIFAVVTPQLDRVALAASGGVSGQGCGGRI